MVGTPIDVVMSGRFPDVPVVARQLTFHTTDTRDANRPPVTTDGRDHVCVHCRDNTSWRSSTYGTPGPRHDTRGEPSPGSNCKVVGVAVVVTPSGPRGVGIIAVTDTGAHQPGDTQNHDVVCTTPASGGGAIEMIGDGTLRDSVCAA